MAILAHAVLSLSLVPCFSFLGLLKLSLELFHTLCLRCPLRLLRCGRHWQLALFGLILAQELASQAGITLCPFLLSLFGQLELGFLFLSSSCFLFFFPPSLFFFPFTFLLLDPLLFDFSLFSGLFCPALFLDSSFRLFFHFTLHTTLSISFFCLLS